MNATGSASSDNLPFSAKLWLSIILILLNVFTVLANLLVIGIVLGNHRLRKCTNYLVVNLGFADLLFACTSYPFVIGSLVDSKQSTNFKLCQFVGFSDSFYATSASFSVAIIAYERYYSIIHCLHYEQSMMNRKTKPVILAVWIASLLISLAPLLSWGDYSYERYQYKCTLGFMYDKGYFFLKIILTFIIPLTVMLVCYNWIFMVAKRHAASITSIEIRVQNDLVHGAKRNNLNKKHHTGSVFITIVVYIVCWLPINILYLLKNLKPSIAIPSLALTASCMLSLLSSSINPIVYALVTGKFRKGFARLCNKLRSRKKSVTPCKRTSPGTWTLSSARFSRRGSTSHAKFLYRSENNVDKAIELDAGAKQSGVLLDVQNLEKGPRLLSPIEISDNLLSVSKRSSPTETRPKSNLEADNNDAVNSC
ncbi:melatonin receptor type 1B-A-like [Dendronephthya gigantea]|uniref:melatonin receptor type 1B-A-like n=1 Tax=Dendronephthya gigantea TaxID=151771 RepID=UPI00106CE133|nr:melatonin receptor type 1B-A-like [Dendronephthya gigantea]